VRRAALVIERRCETFSADPVVAAERVLTDVLTLKHDKGAPLSRATFDELFLTAHQRMAANNTEV